MSINQGKSAITLFRGPVVLYFAYDKTELFAGIFSENSNLDDSEIFLPVLPSRTYMKLYNIHVTVKMVTRS